MVLYEFDNYMSEFKYRLAAGELENCNLHHIFMTKNLYPNVCKLLYVRYGFEFAILIDGRKLEVKHIIQLIQEFMEGKGILLNMEKAEIKNISDGFTFKGAICKRVKRTEFASLLINRGKNNKGAASPADTPMRMEMEIDYREIYKNMVESKYAKFSKHNTIIPLGTAKNFILN